MQHSLYKTLTRRIPKSAFLIICLTLVEQLPLQAQDEITWIDIEQGVQDAAAQDKIMLINIYTDWCGFCKRLDETTFMNDSVKTKIENHFIPVKINAEMKDTISFLGTEYYYIEEGRRGHHGLAGHLLGQRLGYPTLVYVLQNGDIIHRSPGFKTEAEMLKELSYIKEGHYKTMDWRTFLDSN